MKNSVRISLLALLPALLLLAACDALSDAQQKQQPDLRMSARAAHGNEAVVQGDTVVFEPLKPGEGPCKDPSTCDLPLLEVEEGQGQIRLTGGYFLSPYGIHTLRGKIERDGQRVEVRIRPADHGGLALRVPAPFLYEARVTGLAPGSYQLRVVHERDLLRIIRGSTGDEARAVVMSQEVAVQ